MKRFVTMAAVLGIGLAAQAQQNSTTVDTNTLSAPVETVKPQVEDKVGVQLFFGGAVSAAQANSRNNASDTIENLNYIAPSYKLDANRTLSARMHYGYEDSKGEDAEIVTSYLMPRLLDVKAFEVDGQNIINDARLYIPMGEKERAGGSYIVRDILVTKYELQNGFAAEPFLDMRGYIYTKQGQQTALRATPGVEVTRQLNAVVKPNVYVKYDARWASNDQGLVWEGEDQTMGSKKDQIWAGVGSYFTFGSTAEVAVYAEQEHNRRSTTEDNFKLFNDAETKYNVEVVVNL